LREAIPSCIIKFV